MQHDNLACKEEPRQELIGGKLVAMSPQPSVNHGQIVKNLHLIFDPYLRGKSCQVFLGNVDLYLSEENHFIPDLMVVCDPAKIRPDGVYGAPDLVVEVLSLGTIFKDRATKQDAYARGRPRILDNQSN